MVTILPLTPDILIELCDKLGLTAEGLVWGYTASQGADLLGYCIVTEGDPCQILALHADDKYIADGLCRRALHPFYEDGVKEYTFRQPPDLPMLPDYVIIGNGSLEKIFTPHCAS